MTVRELIEELSKMNSDYRVVIDGYEGRYGDVVKLEVREMVINYDPGDNYQGPHEDLEEAENDNGYKTWSRSQIEKVVYIPR